MKAKCIRIDTRISRYIHRHLTIIVRGMCMRFHFLFTLLSELSLRVDMNKRKEGDTKVKSIINQSVTKLNLLSLFSVYRSLSLSLSRSRSRSRSVQPAASVDAAPRDGVDTRQT